MVLIIRDRATSRILNTPERDFWRGGLLARLRMFVLRRRADAMLRRAIRRRRPGSIAHLSPRLREDIGLPPDFRI